MKTLLVIFALSLPGWQVANAASSAGATGPGTIETKTKSTFSTTEVSRNPFWPIGWKPAAKATETAAEHAGPEIPESAFAVTSITLDPAAHFAIINGKTMQEGQTFGLQMGSNTYQLTVKAIEDGRVVLLRRDQEIVVRLRRH